MALPNNLKQWTSDSLRKYNLWAGVKRGQHFLIDKDVLISIIKAAKLKPTDRVLEVGGGLGSLTLCLVDEVQSVVTVELEDSLVKALRKFLPTSPNLKVLAGDILKITDAEILSSFSTDTKGDIKIVANLPYDISGAFLKRFLSTSLPITELTLLLQKEVAERLTAQPGEMSLLSILANLNGQTEIVRLVPPTCFFPPPQVESAVVKIKRYSPEAKLKLLDSTVENDVWRWARVGFSSRRKMLKNNLQPVAQKTTQELSVIFKKVKLNDKVRAQELNISQWIELTKYLE